MLTNQFGDLPTPDLFTSLVTWPGLEDALKGIRQNNRLFLTLRILTILIFSLKWSYNNKCLATFGIRVRMVRFMVRVVYMVRVMVRVKTTLNVNPDP